MKPVPTAESFMSHDETRDAGDNADKYQSPVAVSI